MQCTIMTNGEYAALFRYRNIIQASNIIICADGGANYAYQMDIIPACIVGDLDSIRPKVLEHYIQMEVPIKKYPKHKDFTDTQLALTVAENMGVDDLIFLGSLGGRLDHTLSNLYGCLDLVAKGRRVVHYHPDYQVYIINKEIEIQGVVGDLISVMSLTDISRGVTEIGFEYPLNEVVLETKNPYAVSNVLTEKSGIIRVEEGILAVFHYPQWSEQ